jgi:DNA ligase (NAD+)
MPPAGSAALPDWPALARRRAAEWAQQPGIGAGRAARLQAFFDHPEAVHLAAQLRAAGVDGF